MLETAWGGTCHNTERKRPSEGHSLAGDGRGRDLSEHGKKATEQGALTCWRPQREALVRIQKESDQAGGTHILEIAERGTCQDAERKRLRVSEGTHQLETVEGGTCRDTERK